MILGYGLYRLALAGHLAAALILPLYYLWDFGATLLRRLSRGEAFWEAHRSHVYQRATNLVVAIALVALGAARLVSGPSAVRETSV